MVDLPVKSSRFAASEKLRSLMAAAVARNPIDLPALGASGPTLGSITTTPTSGLAQTFTVAANPAAFTTYGGPPYVVSGSRYAAKSATSAPATFKSHSQRWAFKTDSVKFDINVFGRNSGLAFRLLVDGQYVSKSMSVPVSDGASQWFPVDWTSVDANPKMRRYDVEFYGGNGNSMIGLALNAADIVQPVAVASRYRIGVIGDSITDGTGSTVPGGGYAYQAGMLLGGVDLDIVPIAIGGTGYITSGPSWPFTSHLDDLLLQTLDEVWVCGGVNDSIASPAALQAGALATFQGIRSRLPQTPIVVWGSFVNALSLKANNNPRETAIKAAFDQLADANSAFVPMQSATYPPQTGFSDVTGNTARYNNGDGVHPPQPGHDMLGRWAAEQRRALAI